jgi:hypothetical protein
MPTAQDRRRGEIILRATTKFRVDSWLAGSTTKADRPTLAELHDAGYEVIKRTEAAA